MRISDWISDVCSSDLPRTGSLAVALAGRGAGEVTSVPAGIDCGTTCEAQIATGTAVTLTAAPAAGSRFAGWEGACTENGRASCRERWCTSVYSSVVAVSLKTKNNRNTQNSTAH